MAQRLSLTARGIQRNARHLIMHFHRSHSGRPIRDRDSFALLKAAFDLFLDCFQQLVAVNPTFTDSYRA